MAYRDQYFLAANDSAFLQRVTAVIAKVALDIYSEVGTTPGHGTRAVYAAKVLQSPSGFAGQFAFGITADATINAASTDQNLYDRVSAIWNAYAGV